MKPAGDVGRHVLHVVHRLRLARATQRLQARRNRERREDAHDRYDGEELDERKGTACDRTAVGAHGIRVMIPATPW